MSTNKDCCCCCCCLTTITVQIEITSSLDTDSFINALCRFISLKGNPSSVYSDNGSAGEQELRTAIEDWNQFKKSHL